MSILAGLIDVQCIYRRLLFSTISTDLAWLRHYQHSKPCIPICIPSLKMSSQTAAPMEHSSLPRAPRHTSSCCSMQLEYKETGHCAGFFVGGIRDLPMIKNGDLPGPAGILRSEGTGLAIAPQGDTHKYHVHCTRKNFPAQT